MDIEEPTSAQFEAGAKWAAGGCYSTRHPMLAWAEERLKAYGVLCNYIFWEPMSSDVAGSNLPLVIAPRFELPTVHPELPDREHLVRIAPFIEAGTLALDGLLHLVRTDVRPTREAAAKLAEGLEEAAGAVFSGAYMDACGFVVEAFHAACLPTSEAAFSLLWLRDDPSFFEKVNQLRQAN